MAEKMKTKNAKVLVKEAKAALLRATYHLPPDLAEKLRDVAWWDRLTVNELVRTALEDHVRRLEKKRGAPYPKRGGVLRRGKPLA
jgi:hypothetical protein